MDSSRKDHIVAEIIATDPHSDKPNNERATRHFDLGYVPDGPFEGKLKFFQPLKGRVISPDWIFMDKARKQYENPKQQHLQLVAVGVLNQSVFCKLKRLVESSQSRVQHLGSKDSRWLFQITHPAIAGYQGLTLAACTQKNCASFIMSLFDNMIVCTNMMQLVVPGSCRPKDKFSCTERGLLEHAELPCGSADCGNSDDFELSGREAPAKRTRELEGDDDRQHLMKRLKTARHL